MLVFRSDGGLYNTGFWFVALTLGWLCDAGVLGLNGLISGFEFRF